MYFSFKYLKKLANLHLETNVKEVAEAFNNIGFETESVIEFSNKLKGIKFGQVIELSQNEKDKNLYVAKVLFADKTRIIQTRANNLFKNAFVLASVPGSFINGEKIKAKELKGIVSEGMLLSLEELGVAKTFIRKNLQNQIAIFDQVDLKTDPFEYLDLNDWIIEIDILSNRADACSYLVMAKELAAYFNVKPQELKLKSSNFTSQIKVNNKNTKELVCLETQNDFHISIFEQILLAKSHFQSVDNVNDLANLTFLHSGQPVAFFAKGKVKNDLKVKLIDSKGENNSQGLTFISNSDSLGLVTDFANLSQNLLKNQELVFAIGQFDNVQIRNMLKKTKNFNTRAIQLSKRISSGTIHLALNYFFTKLTTFSKPINFNPQNALQIPYDFTSLKRLIGLDLSKNETLLNKLATLGFVFKDKKMIIPFYRYDLFEDQDIDEEVLRIYGYDKIQPIQTYVGFSHINETQNLSEKVVALNFSEVKTYTLTSKYKNIINPFDLQSNLTLKTFVSNERRTIRKSQAISLLEIIENHLKQKIDKLSLFSEGMIANKKKTYCLASNEKTFNQMKQCAINLLPEGVTFKRFANDQSSVVSNVSAKIMFKNQMIGWLGKVNPLLFNKTFLNDVFILEFIKDNHFWTFEKNKYDFAPLKKRDITIELVQNEDLDSKWKDIACFSVKVVDIFYKDNLKKVTLRVLGNEEEIALIDKKFN